MVLAGQEQCLMLYQEDPLSQQILRIRVLSKVATTMARARATAVATTIAMATTAADAPGTVRRICDVPQAITMPERTARTTGGSIITKDRQVAVATATTTQGADLGHLGAWHRDRDRYRDKNRDGSSGREQNRDRDRPRWSDRRQREVSSNKSGKNNASSMGSALVSLNQARDSVGSRDSDKWSSRYTFLF